MIIPIKQVLLEMAMDNYSYLGSTIPNKSNKSRHIYGVSGTGEDSGLKTILYQSTGSNSGQPEKFFGTTGINYDSEIKDFKPLLPLDHTRPNNWVQKYSIIGKTKDGKFLTLENGMNQYLNTESAKNLNNDHLKVKEARDYMNINKPKIDNPKILSSGHINKSIRNFLKG